jgi:hypothetical protein
VSAPDDPLRDAVRKRRASKLRQVDADQEPEPEPAAPAVPRVSAGTGTGQAAIAADVDPLRAAIARAQTSVRLTG